MPKSLSSLVLFKMTLLQTWYNLSDMGVEDMVYDTPSFMRPLHGIELFK
jgi:IS5 family transposase